MHTRFVRFVSFIRDSFGIRSLHYGFLILLLCLSCALTAHAQTLTAAQQSAQDLTTYAQSWQGALDTQSTGTSGMNAHTHHGYWHKYWQTATALSVSSQALKNPVQSCPEYIGVGLPPPPGCPGSNVPVGAINFNQQPAAGARVYLLGANTVAYGGAGFAPSTSNASISLLDQNIENLNVNPWGGGKDAIGYYALTGPDGSFNLTGGYMGCNYDTPNKSNYYGPVYALALGGDTTGNGANPSFAEMAVLGNCPASGTFSGSGTGSIPYLWISEATTAAAAYAMAGFATDATHVSSDAGVAGNPNAALAATGIANAFNNAANLASISDGNPVTFVTATNGLPDYLTIGTVGNMISACVNYPIYNSNPTNPCAQLFAIATSDGTPNGTQPTETATAAINIAHYPISNVSALYNLSASYTDSFYNIYSGLTAAPNDFTANIVFSNGTGGCTCTNGPGEPSGVAIDGSGNVWTANYNQAFITEISSMGATIGTGVSNNPGFTEPEGVAIDRSGNAWVASSPYFPTQSSPWNELQVFTSNGTAISAVGTATNGGLYSPVSVAFDVSGNAWVSNNAVINNNVGSVSEFNSTLGPGFQYGDPWQVLYGANGIATDSSDYIWVSASNNVVKLNSAGVPVFSTSVTSSPGGLYSIAMDKSGNAWVADANTNTVTELSSQGGITGAYTGGGLSEPRSLSIDGAGNVWVASTGSPGSTRSTITELSGSGAPLSGNGYVSAHPGLGQIAIDGSGDAWLPGVGVVVEYIGIAAPVVTPLATAVATSSLGTRP